jgi:1-deoxy-D-xylulose-5-phosphate synthase
MYTAQLPETNGPFSIRYPRGNGVLVDWRNPFQKIKIGKGRLIKEGEEVAILSIGHPGNFVVKACEELLKEGFSPAHYDMRFVKPLDGDLLHEIFSRFKKILTVEDGCLMGGFGSAVAEFMLDHKYSVSIKRLGIPDRFVDHGEQKELYSECHFDSEAIKNAVRHFIGESVLV